MLTARPTSLDPDFHADFSHGGAACAVPEAAGQTALPAALQAIDHHCQICPTCSHRLTGHRCKLVCTCCGYYLSCADYY
jgi:hypothetical protein